MAMGARVQWYYVAQKEATGDCKRRVYFAVTLARANVQDAGYITSFFFFFSFKNFLTHIPRGVASLREPSSRTTVYGVQLDLRACGRYIRK